MLKAIEKEFNEAVEIRQELNNVLWKDFDALKTVFDALFSETGGFLKKLSDLNYYTGGYPGENTPAKVDSMFTSVGRVAQYYAALRNLEGLNDLLRPYGVRLEATAETVRMDPALLNADDKKLSKALKRVKDRYDDFDVRTASAAETIEWFLEKTHVLQGVICSRADEIKEDIFDRVSVINGDIDKGGFMSAVNRYAAKKTKVEQGKDVENLVAATIDKADTLRANGELLEETIAR
jgi:hypothetical protein